MSKYLSDRVFEALLVAFYGFGALGVLLFFVSWVVGAYLWHDVFWRLALGVSVVVVPWAAWRGWR